MIEDIFKFFLKLLLYLLAFALILGVAVAIIFNISLLVGIFVGTVFSPILYRAIEKKLNIEFPEFTKFQITEIAGVLDAGKEEFESKVEEMRDKRNKADDLIHELQMDVQSIQHEYEMIKQSGYRKLITKKKTQSERMKKAMEQVLGNPRWIKKLKNIDETDYFENLKI